MEYLRLLELNRRFLEEVAHGKTWDEMRELLAEIKQTARQVDFNITSKDVGPTGRSNNRENQTI